MGSSLADVSSRAAPLPSVFPVVPAGGNSGEARLLLEAFEMFTQASSSLETAFQQLQARAQYLSDELEVKNRALEKSLREKEEVQNYLNTILESLPCGVLVLDEENKVALCNPIALQILGEPENARLRIGKDMGELSKGLMRDYYCSCRDDKQEVELPYICGGITRFLSTSGTSLTDGLGHKIGTLHIIRDVTEMKALQEQGKRGERLSAMGEMAVELAHEIRNPLGSIELFASLLEKELPGDTDPGRWAANIRIGSRSLNNIVSNMLHFANPLLPTFAAVNLHEAIEEILGFTSVITSQREVRVESQLNTSNPLISGDRELIKQMILNLVLNALQAMPSCGSLTIVTRDVSQLPGGAPCGGVELLVQDTGFGIPPENLCRIFDPFFTTNKNGTGLGLSVVHQIVDRHSGFIRVESEVNVGTTFTIVLPSTQLVSGAA